jgi:acyl-CoA reductase-like NAD-dependent aldehyde dehydrogenase
VCCFTKDGQFASERDRHVLVYMVGISMQAPVSMARHSFGSWKKSTLGDMHAYSDEGVCFYVKRKSIIQRWVVQY